MNHAKENETPVIFITDDRKDDWWEISYGKTIGPRPELIKEFIEFTKQKVLFYTPDSFLLEAKQQLKSDISSKSIDEIEADHDLRAVERAKSQSNHEKRSSWLRFSKALDAYERRMGKSTSEVERLLPRAYYGENELRKKFPDGAEDYDFIKYKQLQTEIEGVQSERSYIMSRLARLDDEVKIARLSGDAESASEATRLRESLHTALSVLKDRYAELIKELEKIDI